MKKLIAPLLIAAVLVIAGCAEQPAAGTNDGTGDTGGTYDGGNAIPIEDYNNSYKPPEGSPVIAFIKPADSAQLTGSTISVKVNVTSFQLVNIVTGRQNVVNQGHIVYTIDGTTTKTSVYKDDSIANLAPGQHTLVAELVNNDGTSLTPAVKDTVTFTTA